MDKIKELQEEIKACEWSRNYHLKQFNREEIKIALFEEEIERLKCQTTASS